VICIADRRIQLDQVFSIRSQDFGTSLNPIQGVVTED
jgi:hypothetical protein